MNANTVQLPPPANTTSESAKPKRSTGRTAVAVIVGAIGVLLALGGIGGVIGHLFVRDDDGYYTKSTELQTASYALATDQIHLDDAGAQVPDALLGDFRVRATATNDKPVFLAIGPTADVKRYLTGVEHTQVADFDNNGDPVYENVAGKAPRSDPAEQKFWTVQSEGTGEQTLDWNLEQGDWTILAMNADGSRGVAIDGDIGAKVGWLIWVSLGLLLAGALLIGGAVALDRGGRRPG
jgi:hypothetical protein